MTTSVKIVGDLATQRPRFKGLQVELGGLYGVVEAESSKLIRGGD